MLMLIIDRKGSWCAPTFRNFGDDNITAPYLFAVKTVSFDLQYRFVDGKTMRRFAR